MQDNDNINYAHDDTIDIKELLNVLISRKWVLVYTTAFFSVVGVIYSLLLPNIYQSKTLLAPKIQDEQSGLMQNYGGIASLAGIDITGSTQNNSTQALEKIKTLSFFENHVLPNIYLPDLMAYKSWNQAQNSSEYDQDIYDQVSASWITEDGTFQKSPPSSQKSYLVFMSHLEVFLDKKTSFVTIKVKHQNPYVSQQWTELLVEQINSYYSNKDKIEAEKASIYISERLTQTNLAEIKQVLASLLRQEIQKLTLVEANDFYVYEYIDPPAVMERKAEPSRARICIFFTFFGIALSLAYLLFNNYIVKKYFNKL